MSDKTIILQPKYVADFQCDGSKCNAKCCGNNWRIDIDVDTYKKYQRIKNPVIRKKILSSIQPSILQTGFEIKLNEARYCPLLCDDKLCYIQKNLGKDVLSTTCKGYPRIVRHIGEYQFRILSMTCPVAAEKALFSSDGMEMYNIDDMEDTTVWQLVARACEKKDMTNSLFAANIIMGGLSILQNVSYNMEQRMVLLGLFLDKVEECQNDIKSVFKLIDYYNSVDMNQKMFGLWENWRYYPRAHRQFLVGIFKVLQEEKRITSIVPIMPLLTSDYDKLYSDKHQDIQKQLGSILERYWQHEWIFNAFPFAFNGSIMHNYFAYLIVFEICKIFIYSTYEPSKPWGRKEIFDILGELSKYFDHKKGILEILVKETAYFEQEPLKLMQVLLRLK